MVNMIYDVIIPESFLFFYVLHDHVIVIVICIIVEIVTYYYPNTKFLIKSKFNIFDSNI